MEKDNLKVPVYASLMLAFAGIGDAFLYPFLPINFQAVGVSIGSVGILLSINRFVRLFTNHIMIEIFQRFGFRSISILASTLAIITTFAYGYINYLWLWIIVRILWGLCFSALRLSSLTYALESRRKGFSLGLNGSINELGALIALIIGPILLSFLNIELTFTILGIISIPAFFFSYKLPELFYPKKRGIALFLSFPNTFNSLIFISSLIIEGVLIVLVSKILKEEYLNISSAALIALAAFYLNFRRICKLILSPFAGWISDKIGFEKVFGVSLLLICIGLLILSVGNVTFGLITIFIFNGVNIAVVPGRATEHSNDKVHAISETSTWRDLGAAVGTLLGGVLLTVENLSSLFWIPSVIMLMLLYFQRLKSDSQLKQLAKWK